MPDWTDIRGLPTCLDRTAADCRALRAELEALRAAVVALTARVVALEAPGHSGEHGH